MNMWLLATQPHSAADAAAFLWDSHGRGVAGLHLPYPLDMDIVFSILWINDRRLARFLSDLGDQGWTMEAATTSEIVSPSVVDLSVGAPRCVAVRAINLG